MSTPPTEPVPPGWGPPAPAEGAASTAAPEGGAPASPQTGAPVAEPAKKPSTLIAALAATLPATFTFCACALFALVSPGRMTRSFEEMGGAPLLMIIAATFGAVLLTTALSFASAKGYRVPSALSVGAAALPWLAGLAGTLLGMRMVEGAVSNADASSRAALMAMGIAEASQSRLFGTLLSSGLLSAVAFAFAIGSLNQRAPGRRLPVGAAVGLAAAPLVALSLYGALPAGLRGAVLVLAALAALLATVLGAAGAGADLPHGRSGALAAATPMAAGLSVLATALAIATASEITIFSALARADSASRGEMLVYSAQELGPLTLTASAIGPLALLAAAAVAAWAFTRSKPGVGAMIGGAAVAILALSLAAGDWLVNRSVTSSLDSASATLWGELEDFTPVVLTESSRSTVLDGVVTPAGLLDADGATLSSLDAAPLAEALRRLYASREARIDAEARLDPYGVPEEEVPAWLEEIPDRDGPLDGEPSEDGGRAAWERRGDDDAGQLELAFDSRLDARALRALFAALEAAEVPALVLHGIDEGAIDEEQRGIVAGAFPTLAPLLRANGRSMLVRTTPPASVAESDESLRHGIVGASPMDRLQTRPGAGVDEDELALDAPRRLRYGREDSDGLVFLGIGDDATAQSLVATADRAIERGLQPVVVSGAIPGGPERTFALEDADQGGGSFGSLLGRGGSGLGNRGGIGLGNPNTIANGGHGNQPASAVRPGSADVRGSLSREAIQRVVRGHIPEVRYCYERRLAESPDLAGRVTVSFIISPSGSVQSASVRESTLGDSATETCITSAVRRWTFPEPQGGGVVGVNYPFVLTSG